MITAVYGDGSVIEFEDSRIYGMGGFENEGGKRPVRFIIPAEVATTKAVMYLRAYVQPNWDEKVDTVTFY